MSEMNSSSDLIIHIREAIQSYLQTHGYERMALRSVMFDMDGVLYDSMPLHARCWHLAMSHYGLALSEPEAFLHEGRTGADTINIVIQREQGRQATAAEAEEIYNYKATLFHQQPEAPEMTGATDVLQQVKAATLTPVLVTGSGQRALLQRLQHSYPNVFTPEHMVTAFDVQHGKPNPEPYLMGLRKGGDLQPNQSMVVENAPLGVEAAVRAGVFTVAVNTGPLPDEVLLQAGANLLFPSMTALSQTFPLLIEEMEKMGEFHSY